MTDAVMTVAAECPIFVGYFHNLGWITRLTHVLRGFAGFARRKSGWQRFCKFWRFCSYILQLKVAASGVFTRFARSR
jgi:hypothetical protein